MREVFSSIIKAGVFLWALWSGERVIFADEGTLLTQAVQLKKLSPEQAGQGLPVRINGVVTGMRGANYPEFFVQDETGGVIAHLDHPVGDTLQAGQQVEIEGVTDVQQPTPRVRVKQLKTGVMLGLPEAQQVTPADLMDASRDCLYVELTGTIRAARVEDSIEPPRLVLDFGRSDQRLGVWISYFDESIRQQLLPDATVRLRGICLAWKTASLQPFSIFVVVSDPAQIEIVKPAVDPWQQEYKTLQQLRHPQGDTVSEHRQRVGGVVTLHWPGKMLVIEDDTAALRVTPPQDARVILGDAVEVAGFVARQEESVLLEDAVVRLKQPEALPIAEVITAEQLIKSLPKVDREFKQVRMKAHLKERVMREAYQVLIFEDQGHSFQALLPAKEKLSSDIKPGASLEVTGVCRPLYSEKVRRLGRHPDGFELWLPDARSIASTAPVSWWTNGRLMGAAILAACILILVAAWGWRTRLRMKHRTLQMVHEMRARHEAELLAAERMRLAGDLHDTLSQSMAGAAMQLDVAASFAAEKSADALPHLLLARRLLDRGREDLRRTVWDLRPSALVGQSLVSALAELAEDCTQSSACRVVVGGSEDVQEIPERLRSHLYRVAQEAVANALTHAAATMIEIDLANTPTGVKLTIRDNGKGFDVANAPPPEQGHLGLTSMRERVLRLGGMLEIVSTSSGTTVTASVPLKVDEE